MNTTSVLSVGGSFSSSAQSPLSDACDWEEFLTMFSQRERGNTEEHKPNVPPPPMLVAEQRTD